MLKYTIEHSNDTLFIDVHFVDENQHTSYRITRDILVDLICKNVKSDTRYIDYDFILENKNRMCETVGFLSVEHFKNMLIIKGVQKYGQTSFDGDRKLILIKKRGNVWQEK